MRDILPEELWAVSDGLLEALDMSAMRFGENGIDGLELGLKSRLQLVSTRLLNARVEPRAQIGYARRAC